MEGDIVICRCEEITEREIREAIRRGATSVNTVKRWTRAGMGLCQGKTCQSLICRIIAEELGRAVGEIPLGTVRPPVRPIPLSALAGGVNDDQMNPARNE